MIWYFTAVTTLCGCHRIRSVFRVLEMYNFASSSNPAFIKEVVLLLSSYGAKNLCFEITDFLVLSSPAVHVLHGLISHDHKPHFTWKCTSTLLENWKFRRPTDSLQLKINVSTTTNHQALLDRGNSGLISFLKECYPRPSAPRNTIESSENSKQEFKIFTFSVRMLQYLKKRLNFFAPKNIK